MLRVSASSEGYLEGHYMTEFTPAKLAKLRKAYGAAVASGAEQFEFEGHPLLVAYAKYLIEYLEGRFNGT